MSINNSDYNDLDRKIAVILANDATLTNNMISELVDLSASAVHERIRKLKNGQKIKKIVAFLDSNFMEMQLASFISVIVDGKDNNKHFIECVKNHKNVLECHHMTGDFSYLLKVRVKDTQQLESFISDFLKELPGVTKSVTEVVLSSPKDESIIVD
ncbi:MAG: Lrp/AsnC family transcriptional regulator [Alphaproteobacteria bacterium]|nr:Lrp/AsnC family transcriptional regulator [Alphaproteobacteria bacterium]